MKVTDTPRYGPSMRLTDRFLNGAIAGATGTLALDVVTYLDMIVRGRPASELPGRAAAKVAGRVGIDIAGDDDVSANRRDALGALVGYTTGAAIGALYGAVRGGRTKPAGFVTMLGIGAAAMAVADGALVAQRLTDPREWGVAGWLSDLVPHVAYGAVVARVTQRLAGAG